MQKYLAEYLANIDNTILDLLNLQQCLKSEDPIFALSTRFEGYAWYSSDILALNQHVKSGPTGIIVTNLRDVTANIVVKITAAYEKIVFHRCAACAVVWLVIVIRKKKLLSGGSEGSA